MLGLMRPWLALAVVPIALWLTGCCGGSKPNPNKYMATEPMPVSPPASASAQPVERKDHEVVTWLAALLANKGTDKPSLQSKSDFGPVRYYKAPGSADKTGVAIEVGKDPKAWSMFVPREVLSAKDILATSGAKEMCAMRKDGPPWYEVESGAFAGAYVLDMDDKRFLIISDAYAEAFPQKVECLGVKRCEAGKSPRAKYKAQPSSIMVACRDLVRQKLLSPSGADFQGIFSGLDQPAPQPDCSYTWTSWVDAPNAFNVKIRKNFTCTWDPTTDLVTGKLD